MANLLSSFRAGFIHLWIILLILVGSVAAASVAIFASAPTPTRLFSRITRPTPTPAANSAGGNAGVRTNYCLIRDKTGKVLYHPGDVNNDGRIDSRDAAIVLQYSAGLYNGPRGQPDFDIWRANANVNGDNILDSKDALLILQFNTAYNPDCNDYFPACGIIYTPVDGCTTSRP